MKMHIFVFALIVLTVGCQPAKDGNLLSHYESDPFSTNFKERPDTTATKIDGQAMSGYSLTTSSEGSENTPEVSAEAESSINEKALASAYDAIVRLRMDIAGTKDPSEEINLLEKLLQSKNGAGGVNVIKAVKEKKIALDIKLSEAEKSSPEVEMTILAQAFKQIAAAYGFDDASQALIGKAILSRSQMLAPSAAQKSLAQVNGQLLQDKMNAVILTSATNKSQACVAMKSFSEAITNFYEDDQYSLPALIRNKVSYVRTTLSGSERCNLTYSSLLDAVEMITFDLGSLELYLTPTNEFNWELFENYKIKATLQEAVALVKAKKEIGTLSPEDVICKLDGADFNIQDFPLKIEKAAKQRGVTVSFVDKGFKVNHFQSMTLTKINPDILVPAVNLIPGEDKKFDFTFFNPKKNSDSTISCSVTKR